MKRRQAAYPHVCRTASIAVRTGEHCPNSGWWSPDAIASAVRYISEGNVMPTFGGAPVLWLQTQRSA
ncbi:MULTISPECIES: hypothetical protein [unclassified Arthrobacter]|uniref:hypothetical protein n=1 Tax=unclassified Arthrobacter TaxID=235627 RepID=UPI000CFDABCD|nr:MULTISPECIES: hypothetical protein [unclassified Arthrobacter]